MDEFVFHYIISQFSEQFLLKQTTASLDLYYVFILVKAENAVLQK